MSSRFKTTITESHYGYLYHLTPILSTLQKKVRLAELETEKAYEEITNLKKNYDRQIVLLNQLLADSRLPREALAFPVLNESKLTRNDAGGSLNDHRWGEEFEPVFDRDTPTFSKDTNPTSWYSDYDRCNI